MFIKKLLKKNNFIKTVYLKLRHNLFIYINVFKAIYYKLIGQKVLFSYYAHVNNFGDLFNNDLISYFNVKLIYTKDYKKSQASLVGSILGMYPRDFNGFVLGSGFILERYIRKNNNWKILLIRGPLSAKQCEPNGDFIFGDPAILASLVFKDIYIKKYRLGIIPHSRDYDDFKFSFDEEVLIINPKRNALLVAKDIMQCKHIASSSLHGLIFADSYCIPNIHLKLGDKVIGGFHKFDDYYMGMGLVKSPMPLIYNGFLNTNKIIESCKHNFSERTINDKQQEIIKVYEYFFEINNN